MSKYYLMNHQHLIKRPVDMTQEDADLEEEYIKISEEWILFEKGVDCKRMPTGLGWHCLYEDNSLTSLLKQIQEKQDWRFYTLSESLSSKGERSTENYPYHSHICCLSGFVKGASNIRLRSGKPYFGAKWELEYMTELWIRPGGWGGNEMYKVYRFKEAMERAVRKYMEEHNLTFGTEEEND